MIEYLRKVYGVKVLKASHRTHRADSRTLTRSWQVNSLNHNGKLKRSTLKSGTTQKTYRTKAFK